MIVLNEINKDEALRYMGHRGEIPQTLKELVLKCEKQLLEVIRPAYIFKCFDIETSEEGVRVLNTSLTFKGNDIKNHLEGCSKAVLMCATIGADAQKRIGLNVGSGNILIPRKSVTAVAGLSQTPVPKKRRGCVCCNMAEVCQYRKRGDHCGF